MTLQASGTHRPGEMDEPMLLVAGRDVPPGGQRIVGDGSLKEESIKRRQVASAHSAGSHEPSQQSLATHSRLSSRELQTIAFGRHRNTIIRVQRRVRKTRAIKVLAEGARSHFPAAQRHAGSGILAVDLRVAAAACFAAHSVLPHRRRQREQRKERAQVKDSGKHVRKRRLRWESIYHLEERPGRARTAPAKFRKWSRWGGGRPFGA